jgi:Raf kinase inhibitor-like YbhB/YbcL family protein
MAITIQSHDFEHNFSKPIQSLCSTYGGIDLSPSLFWSTVPNAQSYALICFDPDVPGGGTFIHWVISYIPSTITTLPNFSNVDTKFILLPDNQCLVQGLNSFGQYGYCGPCPSQNGPKLPHHYHFVIYALNTIISNDHSDDLMQIIEKNQIAKGSIIGLFLNQASSSK